jgi:hypothetical protein
MTSSESARRADAVPETSLYYLRCQVVTPDGEIIQVRRVFTRLHVERRRFLDAAACVGDSLRIMAGDLEAKMRDESVAARVEP